MKLSNTLVSLYSWTEMVAVTIAGTSICYAVAPFFLPWDRRKLRLGRLFRLTSVTAVKLNPMWKFSIYGPVPKLRGRTVVISNHVSHTDSFLISHLPWEMKWLAKDSLFKVPFLGWGMRLAGDVPIKRDARGSIQAAMTRCSELLQQDVPCFIFPEGTRSKTDEMLPFKDGAFRLAIENQADIMPLAVAGTRRALPKNSWRVEYSRGMVKVGTPISTAGMTMDDLDRLKDLARKQIQGMVEEMTPLCT